MPTNSAVRLAIAVLERRNHLAKSQLEIWQAGGPSNTTLTSIENGRIENLTNATAKKLDAGLEWQPGTALKIWRGNAHSDAVVITNHAGEPIEIEDLEFVRGTVDAARRRDGGDERAMLGTLKRLAEVLADDDGRYSGIRSIRIAFRPQAEESNAELLSAVQREVLSEPADRTDLALAADPDDDAAGESESYHET